MMTRRTALGAGVVFASVLCTAGSRACAAVAPHGRKAQAIDALLIDETIAMPRPLAEFIAASGRTLPVVGVHLDAAAHSGLMRLLDTSRAVVGISSGATLFCLERMAWDHGFRLTSRRQWCSDEACWQEVAAFVKEVRLTPDLPSTSARSYRPSRTDRTLHAWVMRKPASARPRQGRREIGS